MSCWAKLREAIPNTNIFHETPTSRYYNLRGSSTKLCLPQPKTDYLKKES